MMEKNYSIKTILSATTERLFDYVIVRPCEKMRNVTTVELYIITVRACVSGAQTPIRE